MFKLRVGYLVSGIATGLTLLFSFIATIPDGKLHVVFCDVGQGDAVYIRFPDGRDMLVDAGPNNRVLACLGRHMPFWDRYLNLVILTHPQRDHMGGLPAVLERFRVDYFVRSDVASSTEGYKKLREAVRKKAIKEKLVTRGERISVGQTNLTILWPSAEQVSFMNGQHDSNGTMKQFSSVSGSNEYAVLGTSSGVNLNDASVVFWLRYGSFDALFTGDADSRVEAGYRGTPLADEVVEVLKVPHHGSKTGMTEEFLDWLFPQRGGPHCASNNITIQQYNNSCPLAVISVGRNSYGHPSQEALNLLRQKDVQTVQTDEAGDVELVSDGRRWQVVMRR